VPANDHFRHHRLFIGTRTENYLLLLMVFAPLAAALLAAAWLGAEEVGLLGVLTSWLLAAVAIRRRGLSWAEMGLSRSLLRRALPLAAMVAVLLLVLGMFLSGILSRFGGLEPDLTAFDALRGDPGALLAMLVVAWTTAAFGEEMLFRAFMMRVIRDSDGERRWWPAVTISSLAFGFAHHYQGLAGMIMTAVIGFVMAVAYLRAGRNLWVPILAHGLYDTVGLLLVFFSMEEIA
jgi:membrane protease YdiL (CAAX protease family)